jgi:ribosomal protein S18 acetylase RimI-like enzyme
MSQYFYILFLLDLVSLVQASETIRSYNSDHDYEAVLEICKDNHKALDENRYCSGEFNMVLFHERDKGHIKKVLEKDGEIIGFILYKPLAAPEVPLTHSDPLKKDFIRAHSAFLAYIAIDTQWQHKGYGKLLFNTALKDIRAQGFNALYSFVEESNLPAIEWHKAQGFEIVTRPLSLIELYLLKKAEGRFTLLKLPLNDTAKKLLINNTPKNIIVETAQEIKDITSRHRQAAELREVVIEVAPSRIVPECPSLDLETTAQLIQIYMEEYANPQSSALFEFMDYKLRNIEKKRAESKETLACFTGAWKRNLKTIENLAEKLYNKKYKQNLKLVLSPPDTLSKDEL